MWQQASSAAVSIDAKGCSTHKVTCVVVGSHCGRAATVASVLTSGYAKQNHGEKSPRSVVDIVVSVLSLNVSPLNTPKPSQRRRMV